jgi:hypothetical protein
VNAAAVAFCLLCFAGASAASDSQTSDAAAANAIRDARFIADELRRCPLWTDIAPQDVDRRKQITDSYLNLARYPTDVIRAGIMQYVYSYAQLDQRYIEAGEKVFAFERVAFEVPKQFRVGERFPYAVLGNPLKPEGTATYIDFLWPYSIGDAGQLVLSGIDVGPTTGPPYNATADFAEIAARLKRRLPAAPVGPKP